MDKQDLMNSIFLGKEAESINSESVNIIDIARLKDFHTGEYGHTYNVRLDSSMKKLIDSIDKVGINEPLIVRPEGEDYEVISGHRRKFAANLLKLDSVPCIIRSYTDDEAIIVMCDGNLQRPEITPSEKAKTYKAKYDAMKRQGKRIDLTSVQLGQKLTKEDTLEKMSKNADDSRSQIRRYIKLNDLSDDLLELVDEGKVKFNVAVEISYLPLQTQNDLYDLMVIDKKKPSLKQVQTLKEKVRKKEKIDINFLSKFLEKEIKLKLDEKFINSILPEEIKSLPVTEKMDIIEVAIKQYFQL